MVSFLFRVRCCAAYKDALCKTVEDFAIPGLQHRTVSKQRSLINDVVIACTGCI